MTPPADVPPPVGASPTVVPPPSGWLWAYRLLGLRLPEQHRAWVVHDIASDQGFRRLLAWRMSLLVGIVLVLGVALLLRGVPAWPLLGGLTGAVIGSRFNLAYKRRRVLAFQRVDERGRPVAPDGLGRLSNGGAVALSAVVLALLGAVVFRVASA